MLTARTLAEAQVYVSLVTAADLDVPAQPRRSSRGPT